MFTENILAYIFKLPQNVLQDHLSIIVLFCENRKVSKLGKKKK